MSSATKHRGSCKLIYYEACVDQRDAKGRERYLKVAAVAGFCITS